MAKRRSRGDGGLSWDKSRQRWVASITVGYTPAGKRIVRRARGRTKTEAKNKLDALIRDHADGFLTEASNFTVAEAVDDWLAYGLAGRAESTKENRRIMMETHVKPLLGARKLRELTAEDVDKWLADRATVLSTSTLQRVRSLLAQVVARAQARDKVKRNVVLLCACPTGLSGRPSKALTMPQAEALLEASTRFRTPAIRAYVVVSLLTGGRTEEMRALTWDHVDLVGVPEADPPVPPSIRVWRSVRVSGDTKTRLSRRTLAMPQRCVDVLKVQRDAQAVARQRAGEKWEDMDLVFSTRTGGKLAAGNVRRAFRLIAKEAGLEPGEWTPRELRHSFVSLLSDSGVPLEQISRLVGHKGTAVTEMIYRHQITPVMVEGAAAMDQLFPTDGEA
ncbi:integrase [Saccharomonospora amisosensis]|uniref:Integrase n=1 Tax=Saccharomonospora amisosensis TaxID=1128677 RepID=A0A7X5UPA2_9PSEU|nr:site-specific integrase [Saccharomonospora amisosensis]NIJ11611.1 integrase [Saccharomonospora amisosensis]